MPDETDSAEVRVLLNDVLPLALAGFCSAVLLTGISFAAREAAPQDSLTVAVRTVFVTLALAAVGLTAFLRRRTTLQSRVVVTPDALVITRAKGALAFKRKSILHAFLVQEGDRWSVEIERVSRRVRVLVSSRAAAEQLLRELGGEVSPARLRLRIKSNYFMFVGTVATWMAVYVGFVLLPWYPLLGVLVALLMLPLAILTTGQTVPGTVVVSSESVAVVRPRDKRVIPLSRIREVHVVAEHEVVIVVKEGGEVPLGLLAHSDLDPPARGVVLTAAQRFRDAVIAAQASTA